MVSFLTLQAIKELLSGALGRLKSAFSWLTGSATRLLIAALCMALIWGYGEQRRATKWEAQANKTAQILSNERLASQEAKAKAEANYRSMANAADTSYRAGIADGDARLAAYVASHRLRPSPANPAAPAQDHGAGLPEVTPTETVLAELSDLRICNANYAYARSAYEWASKLNEVK